MLAIRLQRVGRKAYPTYRVIVQDAHRHPSSGRIVAQVGSFNPHTKNVTLDKEAIEKYLGNGAQPTTRVVKLLQDAKIKLPSWVELPKVDAKKATRHPEKLRKNQPKEAPTAEVAESAETEVAAVTEAPESSEGQVEAETATETAEVDAKAEDAPTEVAEEKEEA
jgi:small subunit ribosomal protein S16